MSMTRARFDAIEADIGKLNKTVSRDGEAATKFQNRLASLLKGQTLQDVGLDMASDDFATVRAADAAVTENIAKLIFGLDEITQSFSNEFSGMTKATFAERAVSIFSRKKSESMKADRVRNASIDKSLKELIRKSDTIGGILKAQLKTLEERNTEVMQGQKDVNAGYETVEAERSALAADVERLTGEYDSLQVRLSEMTADDSRSGERAALETQISQVANQLNTATETLQTKTALQQSLDNYRRQYASYTESLAKQIAAQKTMISKLALDTEQRTILYSTLTESIKTSQQQELAHQIDETGRATDAMADTLMTQIGATAQNRVVTMLDANKAYVEKMREKEASRERANKKFAEDFAAILKDMDNRYMDVQA